MRRLLHPATALLAGLLWAAPSPAQTVKAGAGAYWLSAQGTERDVPPAPWRTEAMRRKAAPTNQWYSALIFNPVPQVLFAQPLSFRAGADGLELALPAKEIVATERQDTEIHYPHRDPIIIAPAAFRPGPARLARTGDWSIEVEQAQGADFLRATLAHGCPFAYLHISRGDVRVTLPGPGLRLRTGTKTLALRVKGRVYALFGPEGVRWERESDRAWLAHMPPGRDYLSAAVLPDDLPATLRLFTAHAYAFLEDTRVAWRYDPAAGRVETAFEAVTRTQEGPAATALLGLYPHQWAGNAGVQGRLGPGYDTVRGRIRLLAANGFTTSVPYPGFVPFWPAIQDPAFEPQLRALLKADLARAEPMLLEVGSGAYWQGKGLQRIAELMQVAGQQGDLEGRDRLQGLLKARVETWFSGTSPRTYFRYTGTLGTLVAYPEEYFGVAEVNDHHFHYGYWIRTMAELALRDPDWASRARWGGMVDLLVKDIATPARGGADFPFLRNFDPYEGHSWASGLALGASGNNQESSSEAVNAWSGLVLWGEATGDRALRDLGAWLYTTEVASIQHYWFDLEHRVFAPEYGNLEASMVFGGKYAHNTWWTDEPRQIKGINLLPITPASLYLGRNPAYVKRSLAELPAQSAAWARRGGHVEPSGIWQDIFAEYLALADPDAALAAWDPAGAVEAGDTRAHTLSWILNLRRMGLPDFSVTADTALFSVFRKPDGTRTYLAYNAEGSSREVRFSDGTKLTVPARTLVEVTAPSSSSGTAPASSPPPA
jgi:endoglucanase Acf2